MNGNCWSTDRQTERPTDSGKAICPASSKGGIIIIQFHADLFFTIGQFLVNARVRKLSRKRYIFINSFTGQQYLFSLLEIILFTIETSFKDVNKIQSKHN